VAPPREPHLRAPWRPALITMVAATAVIAVLSELLVTELGTAQQAFHGTDLFWGGVIFALIGNAAEHGVAVGAARRDHMDLAMAISVGSSLQIALLLAPVLVFASLLLGHPMTLVFSGIEIVAVVLSVVMVAMIAADGETNWLEGAQLIAVYAILVLAFYFVPA
jgi:Ca2+:H+ antiporter